MPKMDVKDLLQKIEWLSRVGVKFTFYPNVDKKKKGSARIEVCNPKAYGAVVKYLEQFGIVVDRRDLLFYEDKVRIDFECGADNEIIPVMEKAARDTEMELQVAQLGVLQKEIKHLAKQSSVAKPGVFSRGIKNVQNSVSALNNIVQLQKDKLK